MIMKLKILAIGIVLFAALLSGCIGDKDNEEVVTIDTFRCTVDDGILDLTSDGQYEMLIDDAFGGGGIYGNYTIRENTVRLKRSFLGDMIVFATDGLDLIDQDGDRWVRD